jgi:hypothetical protein
MSYNTLNIYEITNLGAKFIIATFNKDMWKSLHVIAIYKPPKVQAN